MKPLHTHIPEWLKRHISEFGHDQQVAYLVYLNADERRYEWLHCNPGSRGCSIYHQVCWGGTARWDEADAIIRPSLPLLAALRQFFIDFTYDDTEEKRQWKITADDMKLAEAQLAASDMPDPYANLARAPSGYEYECKSPAEKATAQANYYQRRSSEPANPLAMRAFSVKAEAFRQMAAELNRNDGGNAL